MTTIDKKNCPLVLAFIAIVLFSLSCKDEINSSKEKRGPKWVVYNRQNSSLLGDKINAMAIDRDRSIWLATDSGASNLGSGENITKPLEFTTTFGKSRKVNAIAVGNDGSLWFGLAGGGVRRFNRFNSKGNAWTSHTTPSINANIVFSLAVDINANIWVGTSRGVSRFFPTNVDEDPNDGVWFKYDSVNSVIPNEAIRAVSVNFYDNTIWFCTYSHGIVWYDGDIDWNFDMPSDAPLPITSLTFDASRTVWFGTFGDWAYRYAIKTSEWIHYADSTSGAGLPDLIVNAVTTDNVNNIVWFGTNKGLTKYDGLTWETYDTGNSLLPDNTVTTLQFDKNGNLCIGTANGVAVYNEKGIRL